MVQAVVFFILAFAIGTGLGEGCSGGPTDKTPENLELSDAGTSSESPTDASEQAPEVEESVSALSLPAPKDLRVVQSGDDLIFSWSSVADATGYSLYYASDTHVGITTTVDYAGLNNAGLISTTNVTTYTLRTPEKGLTWYAVVTATGGEGESTVQSPVSNEVFSTFAPAPPLLAVALNADDLVYSWSPVANAQSYTLFYAKESFADLSTLNDYASLDGASQVAGLTTTGYVLTDAEKGTTWYAVATVIYDVSGDNFETGVSNEVSMHMTSIGPENLTVRRLGDDLLYHWDSLPNTAFYSLYYATETFDSLDDLANYTALDGAGVITGLVTTSFQLPRIERGVYWYAVVTADLISGEETKKSNEVPWIIGTAPLNDTGIIVCSDFDASDPTWIRTEDCLPTNATADTAGVDADGNIVPLGLDAVVGRDRLAIAGDLPKKGAGHGGFDFTRINSDGSEYSGTGDYTSDPWDCVLDNETSLMWEVKSPQLSGIHQYNSTFTWHSTDTATNGGVVAVELGIENKCHGFDVTDFTTYCNTEAFVQRVNNENFCGHADWRLPDQNELMSIVKHGSDLLSIDSNFFANAYWNTHWTSVPAVAAPTPLRRVRTVNFTYGQTSTADAQNYYSARLVRTN